MLLPHRLYIGDEELGKKFDDHRPGESNMRFTRHHQKMPAPQRRSVKRVTLALLGLVLMYYSFKCIPANFHQLASRPSMTRSAGPKSTMPLLEVKLDEPVPIEGNKASSEVFNGPIKFYELASTLHDASNTEGKQAVNRNVLFAAASLTSAAILLPLACEMAQLKRNDVHFAIMGRDKISLDTLKTVNGVGQECNVVFHDGRPDFPTTSSDFRMKFSVSSAFKYINTFVNPQATLIDGSGSEESWLLGGIKTKATDLGRKIIEIPKNAEENLRWITTLDSASLSAWDEVSLEIIIHPHQSATGSLIRLLESLKKADYFYSAPPHLIIELPHIVEEHTEKYLQSYKWPPTGSKTRGNMLTLHHRIPQHDLTPEENSIRMLESFWPANPSSSQVLVLSPQVELSPLYFHYLKYVILEYKFGRRASGRRDSLLGISLDLPSTFLNSTTRFIPPFTNHQSKLKSFLWQAPNSNACLYFGQKWIELHDFVSQSLKSQHNLRENASLNKKEVSKFYPSWLEYVLQLAQSRGYLTIYPNFENINSLAIIHNELYQIPEEYKSDPEVKAILNEDLTVDPSKLRDSEPREKPLLRGAFLQNYGELSDLNELPIVSLEGDVIETAEINERALDYRKQFIKEIGGCTDETPKAVVELSARDLFCLGDEELSPSKFEEPVAIKGKEKNPHVSVDV